ncbi:lysophospholipase [Spirillospora sp. NBC_00431]
MSTTSKIDFTSLDGLRLFGTLVVPDGIHGPATVLVHGGGVDREEGGFFSRLALGLASANFLSLRFDFRAHGESEGHQEDLTLSAIVNDIRAAADHVRTLTRTDKVNLIGASFGGGISALFASQHPQAINRLVLLNPLLNYKKRFIDDKPYWHDDRASESAAQLLRSQGFIEHSATFRLGRALLNEVFCVQPHRELKHVLAPTLIVHGTGDTFIPVQSSRDAIALFGNQAELREIVGAQHGFAVHDDPLYRDPQTKEWQSQVIDIVTEWLRYDREV